MGDIVDTAVAAGSFKTLVAAVQAAGMVETLKGKGPFTVFAPDDEAFAKLPPGTMEGLLKNIPRLKAVLMYHIIPGKLTVDEISYLNSAKTIQGQEITIEPHKWWQFHMNPKINDANITSKDIVTDNGMIHVLNTVLMPNMELTCPVCGMGFMNTEAMNAHTKTAHIVEKTPEPMPPAEVMPVAEKAPEPVPVAEVIAEPIPAVEKTPELLPVVEVIPAVELPATAKVTEGVFEILLDAAGKFRFHLKAANGQIIAVSQSYGTKESAIKGIASIKKNAPISKIADLTMAGGTMPEPEPTHAAGIVQDPVFEIQSNAPDKFRFHLKAANGQIIAVSQSYLTRQSTEKGIASVKKNAPMAKVIDHTIAGT
jgi:uncharacterized surface protein with fasciclin (FAS1) repeats/uncharacterized protein YegP (UPF0339 family)